MARLQLIAQVLDDILQASHVPELPLRLPAGSVETEVTSIGLALDLDEATVAWAHALKLEALWVHRHMPGSPATELPLLGHHAAFDRRFGLALNANLHEALGINGVTVLSERPSLSVVRLNEAVTQSGMIEFLRSRYGGIERRHGYGERLSWIALADGMRAELLQAASSAGAELYVTGQWRPSAEDVAEELGLSVVTLGHGPVERRGLRDLAEMLRSRIPGLSVDVKS